VLKNAAIIAGVDCTKLTTDVTALSYQFGLFRKRELTKEVVNTLFIDVGATKTTLSLIGFSNEETKILA